MTPDDDFELQDLPDDPAEPDASEVVREIKIDQARIQSGLNTCGILAGFAITAALAVMAASGDRWAVPYAAGAFIVAAVSLLTALLVGQAVLMNYFIVEYRIGKGRTTGVAEAAGLDRIATKLDGLTGLGVFAFLAGIGLTGWAFSTPLGVVSTAATAVGTFVAVRYAALVNRAVP